VTVCIMPRVGVGDDCCWLYLEEVVRGSEQPDVGGLDGQRQGEGLECLQERSCGVVLPMRVNTITTTTTWPASPAHAPGSHQPAAGGGRRRSWRQALHQPARHTPHTARSPIAF
jgi:hypothetical protein